MDIINKVVTAHSTRGVHRPLLFVLHGITATATSGYNTFKTYSNKKSSTMIVTIEGEKWLIVPVDRTPWTNGTTKNPTSNLVKSMPAGMDINLISLTIEMEEYEGHGAKGDIAEKQFWGVIGALKWLQSEVKRIYGYTIPLYPDRIQPHSAIDAVGKPNCPGPLFPWTRLYSECAKITTMDLDHAEEYIASQQDNTPQRAYLVAARVDDLSKKVSDPKWGVSAQQKLGFLTGVAQGVDTPAKVVATIKDMYAKKDYDNVLQYEKIMKEKALL